LVAYALFRYAMLIETGKFTGPMQIVMKDRAVVITAILWAVIAVIIILTTGGAEQTVAALNERAVTAQR